MASPMSSGSTIKETLISIIIAFVLAFVFRAFVIEAFVIPTGSMAPTLMGQHMRFTGPASGHVWAVGPWYMDPQSSQSAKPVQGATAYDSLRGRRVAIDPPVVVQDPVTQERLERADVPRRSGDRILVLKYLYSIYDPKRWDAVVFKSPSEPSTNIIKRLIGLPGEQIALVDGDLFVRKAPAGEVTTLGPGQAGIDAWSRPGWTIARKPERVQRAAWQLLFDSAYAPASPGFRTPWIGSGGGGGAEATAGAGVAGGGWSLAGAIYQYRGRGPGVLAWDDVNRPITDTYPYNEQPRASPAEFPVSDIRLRAAVTPTGEGTGVRAVLEARGYEFRAVIEPAGGTGGAGGGAWTGAVQMRPRAADPGSEEGWQDLAREAVPALRAGRVTTVEFWHADQSLSLWLDGRKVVEGAYDWGPEIRVKQALGMTLGEIGPFSPNNPGPLAVPDLYVRPRARWVFGGPVDLQRVGLWRDLHYQAGQYSRQNDHSRTHSRGGEPLLATHPRQTPTLGPDQFFVCGDNSPASLDSRAQDVPNPWVTLEIDGTAGVVPRDLLIGKAFFVYFPSMLRQPEAPLPMVDFGRLRFIW